MIESAIKLFDSKKHFCLAIGMTPQFLTQIESGKRPLPPKFALAIERATDGKCTRQQLRPDIYPEQYPTDKSA